MKSRREIIQKIAPKYQKATKKEKGKMLDDFVHLTGYTRIYTSWLLLHHGKRVYITGQKGKKLILMGAKLKKQYDDSKTTLMRVIGSSFVDGSIEKSLCGQYEKLNPA